MTNLLVGISRDMTKGHGVERSGQMLRTHKGMAHFAGTGPAGKKCKDCAHFMRSGAGNKPAPCRKYKQLSEWDKVDRKVPMSTAACKYFELAQARPGRAG